MSGKVNQKHVELRIEFMSGANRRIKQVICMRHDLGMRRGKQIAQ